MAEMDAQKRLALVRDLLGPLPGWHGGEDAAIGAAYQLAAGHDPEEVLRWFVERLPLDDDRFPEPERFLVDADGR